MKKRVLSAILVLCMACGLVSTAWATDEVQAAPTPEPTAQTVTVDPVEATVADENVGTPAPDESGQPEATPAAPEEPETTPVATDEPVSTEEPGTTPAATEEPEATPVPSAEPEASATPAPENVRAPESAQSQTGEQESAGMFQPSAPAPLADVAVTVEDQIKSTGRLVATVSGADEQLTYTWYRKADNGEFQEVTPVKVSGDDYNTEGNWLNVALDIESLCEGKTTAEKNAIRSQTYTYYVVVKQGDVVVATSGDYQVPYYAQLLNGNFEQSNPLVWKTTASDGGIEIGSYGDVMDKYGTTNDKPNSSAEDKFAELNANAAGALYQDVLTVPGADLTWQLDHRARNAEGTSGSCFTPATDTMYVVIMSTQDAETLLDGVGQEQQQNVLREMIDAVLQGETSVVDANYTLRYGNQAGTKVTVTVEEVTTTSELDREWEWFRWVYSSTNQWKTYSGEYTVPAGQYATRFFFAAGDTATGNPTVGNLIDEVWFSPELPAPNPDAINISGTKTLNVDTLPPEYSVTVEVWNGNQKMGEQTITDFDYNESTGSYTAGYTLMNLVIDLGSTPTLTIKETVSGAPDSARYDAKSQVTYGEVTEQDESIDIKVAGGNSYTVNFTNTYTPKTGSLTIQKTVTGVNTEDLETLRDQLYFTVAGPDNVEQVGLDQFTPVQSGSSPDTYVYTFTYAEPVNIGEYTVTEHNYELQGYDWTDADGGQNAIAKAIVRATGSSTPAEFTNTYQATSATLTLTKTFDGLSDAEVNYLIFENSFGWDVNYCKVNAYQTDSSVGNSYTYMAPANELNEFTKPAGGSLNNGGDFAVVASQCLGIGGIEDVPAGGYFNEETNARLYKDDNGNWMFSITMTVPVCDEEHFYTVYEQHADLPGYAALDDSNVTYTIIEDGEVSMNGTGKFVDHGESVKNIYVSMPAEVGEPDSTKFSGDAARENTAIDKGYFTRIQITKPTVIAFTNHYTGKLDVSKSIGNENQYDQAVNGTYTITLTPANIDKLNPVQNGLIGKTVHYYITDQSSLMPATIAAGTDGKPTLTITDVRPNTTLHFVDLPAIQWQVVEDASASTVEGYNLEVSYADENGGVVDAVGHWNGYVVNDTIGATSPSDGIASVDSAVNSIEEIEGITGAVDPSATAEVTVINEYKRQTKVLTITKIVAGAMGSNNDNFDFTIVLTDTLKDNAPYQFAAGSIPDGLTESETEGTYTFTLNGGGEIALVLPYGVEAVVTENLNAASGYKVWSRQYSNNDLSGGDIDNRPPFTENVHSQEITIGVYDEYIDFKNIREAVAPTGLESDHTAPFALMVTAAGIAGLALIGAIVNRRIRRRREE